ncbi:MAG TPA: hypothetical protein VN515_08275 [Terriglobales bacterium]|nr:hypothetical protein [Terriglobales bacterium]
MKLALACVATALSLAFAAAVGQAPAPNPYPKMAPIAKYLMPSAAAEIALARSAAPASISAHAEVLVLTKQGYVVGAKGTNGWVCIVGRSWTAGFDDPEFWNWHGLGPGCLNPPAVRSVLPQYLAFTQWAIAGDTREEIAAKAKAAYAAHQFTIAPGSMALMLSKEGYLLGADGPWRPHVMPFVPYDQMATWGAGFKGSPVLAPAQSAGFRPYQPVTLAIPVDHWSDGSPAPK